MGGDHRDPTPAQRLQTNVHRLRKVLDEPGRLTFASGSYTFLVHPGELDADRFDELVTRTTNCRDPHQRVDLLRTALELWRGSPFQGVDLGELAAYAQRLAERRQVALEELYTAELECGRHTEVVADLTDLARLHPYRERLHALLMTALYRSGRQADALAAYRHTRQTLVDELGLEPGPELRTVEQQILAGESCAVARPFAAPALPPAQLPQGPRDFVGREDELATLSRLSAAGDDTMQVVVLSSTAGVGKTAPATHWAQHARVRFPDGQLYVDLQGFSPHDPLPPTAALGGFLRALGEDSAAIPHDPIERAARFRTLPEGRRVLVVLDNAAAEQVRPLLPGTSSCFVVVTSRDALSGLTVGHGAYRLDVGRMSRDEARALLRARAPLGNVSQESAAWLAERCEGLPLVLRVAAERFRDSDSHDVANLAAELEGGQDRLDLFDTGDDQTSLRAVLSWSYRRLTPEAARLFRMCGFRCRHSSHYLDGPGAAALLGTSDVRAVRRLLGELARCGLVEPTPDGRYQVHQLLQSYAAELADHYERNQTLPRLVNHYMTGTAAAAGFIRPREVAPRVGGLSGTRVSALRGCASALRWLEDNRPNVLCLAELAAEIGHRDVSVDLSTTLWPYFDLGGHQDEARRVHTLARTAANELGDHAAEAIAVRALGVLELRLGRYDTAERHLREALALHDANARASRATTMTYLASVFAATGRVEHALPMARQARDLCSQSGGESVPATAMNALGRFFRQCGSHQEALRWLRSAHDTAERQGLQPVRAHVLFSLAEVHLETGRYASAVENAHQALDLAKNNGVSDLADAVAALRGSIPEHTGTSAASGQKTLR
ncbi:DNA-binding SARP family transcriptional activator/tetratricopeptide (TPR) repeat protein [Lipingzhangella halophila]|uniref:DNA-binding SARP family transcriptional activator/tetratricopeptide (TPR) repeat protein n=1 Tax=Lipingzhangella halophila TaxID=1783352 RepID=A0A7W7RC12_9ACTN|nr:BTAD domain-containing putative transcriptional regulator [Lipingzhangella halophila]MBB4929208.1 DNA-binding SARP family transcriptional activator/tetratricopeptide (TPR) repeat protein [Lipingzhangella halophila]